MVQAYVALQPSAEDVHWGVVQEYCKGRALEATVRQPTADGKAFYIECMVRATGGRRL